MVVSSPMALETVKSDLARTLSPLLRLRRATWVFDVDHCKVIWSNNSALHLWSADTLEELASREMGKDMSASVSKRLRQYLNDFEQDEAAVFSEIWTLYPNKEPCTLDMIYSGIRLSDGRMGLFCEASRRTELDAQALRSAEALLHTSVMITLYAADGEPLYRNPAARSSAHNSNDTLDQHFRSEATLELLKNADSDEVNTVANVQTIDGPCWHDITARRCLDAVSGKDAWLISEVDVSKLKATEERAQFLAEHDLLTQLPNRNHVTTEFQHLIDKILSKGAKGALLFLDLDRFKDINDTLGHAAGDQLLVEVAKRLTAMLKPDDSVARLGGDEFLYLLRLDEATSLEHFANQVLETISQPLTLAGREVSVTPSIGISTFPDNGSHIDDLMRHADLAMYHAKDIGRNDFAFFSQDLSDAVASRLTLEAELTTALAEQQFVAYFQPRVQTGTNTIGGAEALVRWVHPERGLISPATFIPACEASGIIGQVGKIVLAHAVRAQRAWSALGFELSVSVNLSPLQFGEESLVEDLTNIVLENGGKPENFELEITESVLLGHDESTIAKLIALVDKGFRIAIDDFGTGYSNLAYLHRYPIHCLKIDRSFVQILDTARPIVELITQLARLYNLEVVAEGVETEEQLEALNRLGCHEYQGFLFSRPLDFDDFTNLLDQPKRLTA